MDTRIASKIETVPAAQWNRLPAADTPFLRHEFLNALERHGCVGQTTGWLPHHIVIEKNASLLGAIPLYEKFNSYGELVFDWSWADAYARAGMNYYPKWVAAIPYTPVTGPRLLALDDDAAVRQHLVERLCGVATSSGHSSCHVLFPTETELALLQERGFLPRLGVQYHWHNEGYHSFEHFLSRFSSRKRKNVLKERAKVKEAGIQIECVLGRDASPEQWRALYHFYCLTFQQKGGWATLTWPFFQEIAVTMGEQILLHLARHDGNYIAGALLFFDAHCLYGRHWGASQHFDALHFELCYYRGLDFAIACGLQRFEPGAQGEHKISRGFRPVRTHSAHWIAEPRFRSAIRRYLSEEKSHLEHVIAELSASLPFRAD